MATDNADVVTHKDVNDALDAFVAEVVFVTKDGTNPHFKNKYTSYKGLRTQTQEPLRKHGLTIRQKVTNLDGQLALETVVRHAGSSTEDVSVAPLPFKPNDPQAAGSAITYFRRYMLLTALGLISDDDDDGNLAAGREEAKTPQQTAQDFWIAKSDLTKALTKGGKTIPEQMELVLSTLGKPKIESLDDIAKVRKAAGLK